jgi:hypothetical protein
MTLETPLTLAARKEYRSRNRRSHDLPPTYLVSRQIALQS